MSPLLRKLILPFALTATLAASPHDFEVDGIYYNITSSSANTVAVTYGNGHSNSYSGSVVIPYSVKYSGKTYSVTSIGDDAFYDCSSLASVVIPNYVTSIGFGAFGYCSSLASVTIPNSVTSIGNYAFYGCSSLASVVIPNSVTSIGESAFYKCSSIASVEIPNSVTSIGNDAFNGCSSLAFVTIPNSITSIGGYAFKGCSSLESLAFNATNCVTCGSSNYPAFPSSISSLTIGDNVTKIPDYFLYNGSKILNLSIPNSVTSIGSYAFRSCSSLASVVIPNSVTAIGNEAFYGCSALESLAFNATNCATCGSSGYPAFPSSISSLTIGDNVTRIPNYFLYNGCKIQNLSIPNSVTAIGFYAFRNCSSLASVVIPNSVTSIGGYAFYGCSAIESLAFNATNCATCGSSDYPAFPSSISSLTIGDNVTKIPDYFLSNGSKIQNLSLPNSVTSIGYYAFSNCSSLASVVIPNSVTSIGRSAFLGCSSLASVEIPNSVTSIGDDAFNGCSSLASVTIPNSITSIGGSAFSGCSSLTFIEIPNSVTSIGDYAFSGCSSLTSFEIPNSVTSIGKGVLMNCTSLSSFEIHNNISKIGKQAFSGTHINSITFGTGLISIEEDAFKESVIAKAIWLGNTPPTGHEQVNAYANYASNSQYDLNNLKIYEFLSSKFSVNGIVFVPVSPSERTCDIVDCLYNDTFTSATISDKVTNQGIELTVNDINSYSFYGNKYIKSLSISYKGEIGYSAFYGCTALQDANIENTKNIGGSAFYGCTALQTATIKNTGDIGGSAFYGCTALQTATIQNAGNLGSSAFYGCTALLAATIQNAGNIGNSAFYGCTSLQTATIENKGNIGESAFCDNKALKEVKIGNEVTSIAKNAFFGCSAIPEITIPNSVTALGASAFQGCSGLKSATLGTGFPSLPTKVFSGCSSLESISIPNNVTSIADYAFEGCSSLSDISIEDDDEKEPEIEEPTNIQYPDWASTNHADSSESHQEYLLDAKAGDILTFNYSVDSESRYDFFIAKINGSEVIKASGKKSDSFRYQFSEAGQMTLYLSYTKDSSSNSGQDRVVVSDIWLKGASAINTAYITLGSNGSSPLFADCPLDEVYIGRKLSYNKGSNYGYSPFYRNSSLRTVEITDAETEIYDNEFYGCSGLKSLKIGNGVTKIGTRAFSGCYAMRSFECGENAKSIGEEAFSDCTGLKYFTSKAITPPVCGTQALDDINKWECTLRVTQESIDDYQQATQWKEFFFIEDLSKILVDKIELNTTEAEVIVGSTLQLSAIILPANATNQALVWESSDVSVADINGDGLVTGLKEGTATITARSADGNAEATCVLTVKEITGIEAVNAPSAYTLVKAPNGYIVKNAGGTRVEVYSADGRMVYLAPSYTEAEIALPAGLYIVRAANRAWKVRF